MEKRKLLIFAMATMLIVGGSYAAYPFLASMNPSMKANAQIPSINIKGMEPGSYRIATHSHSVEYFRGYKSAVMLVNRMDGQINAWSLLTRNGKVGLPGNYWWQVSMDCKNFGPTVTDGVIDETKPITCHDKLDKEYGVTSNRWIWSIDGVALSDYLEDMEKLEGTIKGDYFILSTDT